MEWSLNRIKTNPFHPLNTLAPTAGHIVWTFAQWAEALKNYFFTTSTTDQAHHEWKEIRQKHKETVNDFVI